MKGTTSMYCTYITFYRGNQMPPFYIGYTSVERINKGYNGTPQSKQYKKIWNDERKNNIHLFNTKILKYYNTRQEASEAETRLQKALNVHKNLMYINMAIAGEKFYNTGERTKESIQKGLATRIANGTTGKGRKRIDVTRRNYSTKFNMFWLNKKRSAQDRFKKSITAKRRIEQANTDFSLIVQCPHCNKVGQSANMKRWHYDKCKSIP